MQELKSETIAGNAHLFANLQLTMSRKSKSMRPENNYEKVSICVTYFKVRVSELEEDITVQTTQEYLDGDQLTFLQNKLKVRLSLHVGKMA